MLRGGFAAVGLCLWCFRVLISDVIHHCLQPRAKGWTKDGGWSRRWSIVSSFALYVDERRWLGYLGLLAVITGAQALLCSLKVLEPK